MREEGRGEGEGREERQIERERLRERGGEGPESETRDTPGLLINLSMPSKFPSSAHLSEGVVVCRVAHGRAPRSFLPLPAS